MEFVEHRWINPGTIEKRDYQEGIVKTALRGNTLCVIPTGLGKTSIATLVVADRLEKDMKKKILFLAPTRPLVEQHKRTFERFLKAGLEMAVVTGHNEPGERSEMYTKADIIFSTPQTIRNDIKAGKINLRDFSLCIFDEAHRAVGNYAYPYVAKVYMNQSSCPLILALTASPGSARQKIEEVKSKLFIRFVEIRTRQDIDVVPYVQSVDEEWVSVELPAPMKAIKQYLETVRNERIKKLIDWKVIHSYYVTKTQMLQLQADLARKRMGFAYAAMSILAEIIKVDHALTLLETECLHSLKRYFDRLVNDKTKAVERLMKDENFKNALRLTVELVNEGSEHPKMGKLKEIIIDELQRNKYSRIMVFAQFRDTVAKIFEELKSVQYAAPVEFIGQEKKAGKGLSQREQVQILNEFKLGFYNILLATQIGEEGLDIEETSLVIFYEPIPSAIRKIQRAGRTARTKPGKVVLLMTKGTRDEAYHWSGFNKEKKMHRVLSEMQKHQKSMNEYSQA